MSEEQKTIEANRVYHRFYYQENREKLLKRKKEYYELNKKERCEYQRKYTTKTKT